MENAIDALKIAFGVLIFVIALSLAFSVVTQARITSDVVLTLNDKTNFYEYIDSSEVKEDRIVGFETILPTIYRYAKEQYAVTILKNDGTPIVRYDLYTEGFMGDWDNILKQVRISGEQNNQTYIEIKERIKQIDDFIRDETTKSNAIWNSLVKAGNQPGDLYKVTSSTNSNIKSGAPWGSDYSEITKRIKADLEGSVYSSNNIKYTGKGLNSYKNSKFKEKFIEIQTSGTTITEEDEDSNIQYSLETVKGNKKLEIIYIMQ